MLEGPGWRWRCVCRAVMEPEPKQGAAPRTFGELVRSMVGLERRRARAVWPHSLVMRVGRNSDGAVPGRNSGAVPVRHSGEGRDSALELQLSEVPFTGRGYPLRLGAGDRAREEAQGYQQQRPAAWPSHSLCRDRR